MTGQSGRVIQKLGIVNIGLRTFSIVSSGKLTPYMVQMVELDAPCFVFALLSDATGAPAV